MSATAPRRGRLSVFVALLCLSLVAGPVAASGGAAVDADADMGPPAATGPGVAAASVSTVNVTDNVSVWDRAPLPFRIDDTDAATMIPTGAVTVDYTPENTGQLDARRTATAMYQPGTVNASFESVTGAGTSAFAGEDAQLVIARVNASASDSPSPVFGSLDEVRSLIDPDSDRLDATYAVTDSGTVDSDGRIDATVQFDRPGNYVVFLTTGGNFSATAGDLSVEGPGTVVGVDTAIVEREAATVTDVSTRVDPGTNASVTVAPATNETNVSVALYHEPTWVNSRTAVTVTERFSASTGPPNVTVGHSIDEINGHTAVEGPVTVTGITYGDGRLSQTTASELVDFLVNRNESAVEGPKTTVIGDGTRLDASVVAERNVSGETTVQVPTRGNWTAGSYRWVVTTDGNRTADLRTATGTLTVASDSGGGFSVSNDRPELENAAFGSRVTRTRDSVEVTLAGTTPGEPVRLTIPVHDSQLAESGYVVTGVTANFTRDLEGDLSVSTPDQAGVPPVSADKQIGYVVIDHSMPADSVSNASYAFLVSERRLDEAGIDPDAVALFRLEADGWTELPTRFAEETRHGYHFVGDSPGLSVYAIAESGSARPRFELNETSLNRTAVLANESVAVNATVTNHGTGPGNFTEALLVDNRSVDNRTVRVPAGERRTLRFTHSFGATAGTYNVSIEKATVGSVTVSVPEADQEPSGSADPPNETAPSNDDENTTTAESNDDAPATEEAGIDLGGRGAILLAVLAVIAVVGIAYYRRYGGV
ncbi:PGF-pre-PGF domain-containing protein [Halorubrum ejinorense]|uniref:PGF-pre-PGF domain-containing protein n=1 Tax=Halorubrum ejinorense TaxID=425309 RepID=A0AAV3STK8_9EURY